MIRPILTLAALALTSSAMAQGNVLRITQEGPGNTLRVDQSRATDSFVGGPSDTTLSVRNQLAIVREAPEVDAEGDPVLDDDDNPFINRTKTPIPNVFTDSLAGLRNSTQSGLQRNYSNGGSNALDITVTGDGGAALFSQTNTGGGLNDGTIDLTGNGTAGLFQNGTGNSAAVTLDAGGLSAGVVQNGDGNSADLTVTNNATGLIVQNGDGNDTGQITLSVAGSQVTYVQNGSGLAPVADAFSIISNAPQVTVIQSNGF